MNQPGVENQTQQLPAACPASVPGWKRTLDLILILLASPLLLSLAFGLSAWILIISGPPILFKQQRIGFRGRQFTCYKFRTMRADADTARHECHAQSLIDSGLPMVKMDVQGDPRLIPFALPIRAAGLDELPQLLNVIRGEMSLVGPRPCLPCEYEKYQEWQRERFNTTPGLTGLWQVSGKNNTTFLEMVQLDIRYARAKSLSLDLKIILKTIPALLVQMYDTRKQEKLLRRG